MRRWGLYVSRPLGPEESVNLFSGGWVGGFGGRRGLRQGWGQAAGGLSQLCRQGRVGGRHSSCRRQGRVRGCRPAAWHLGSLAHRQSRLLLSPSGLPAFLAAEPAVFLINPAGEQSWCTAGGGKQRWQSSRGSSSSSSSSRGSSSSSGGCWGAAGAYITGCWGRHGTSANSTGLSARPRSGPRVQHTFVTPAAMPAP